MNQAHDHSQLGWLDMRRQVNKSPKKGRLRPPESRDLSSLDVINGSRHRENMGGAEGVSQRPATEARKRTHRRCEADGMDDGELLRAIAALVAAGLAAVAAQRAPADAPLSQAEFVRLASNDPDALFRILRQEPKMRASLLTFAAEAVALVRSPSPDLLRACIELLEHKKAYVREGAIYGLAPHAADPRVLEALQRVAESDSDDDVRSVAEDVLGG